MRKRLGKAADLAAALAYLIVLSLPPRPPSPARQREIDLTVSVARREMFARLDSLNAALHAGTAKGHAELAAHYADLSRASFRRLIWASLLCSTSGAYFGYQVASWLS